MKASLQTKFLAVCILVVLVTAAGISATSYVLTRQDKRVESQQRIRIAFDFILNDLTERMQNYTDRFDTFLQDDSSFRLTTSSYMDDKTRVNSTSFLTTYLTEAAGILKQFGRHIGADRLMLYGADGRLLLVYQRQQGKDTVGAYMVSETGKDTYLPMDDRAILSPILLGESIPDTPLPSDIVTHYENDIPETVSPGIWTQGKYLGVKIAAPIYHRDQITGVLVGNTFYGQETIGRYSLFSKTEINVFVGEHLSVGTLPNQTELTPEDLSQMRLCQDILNRNVDLPALPITISEHDYYQGQCAFRDGQRTLGAVTVSFSQDREKEGIRKSLTAVLTVSVISIGAAFALSFILSHKPIHTIQDIVKVIGVVAEGDLRKNAMAMTRDEIGMLAIKVNQMIKQLRTFHRQIQEAAHSVSDTSDTILAEMQTLTERMEQQSATIDNTTDFVERINQFIRIIGSNTAEQLSTAEQVLSSIHEIRASLEEVTGSTGHLATNTQHISSSVDKVSRAIQNISESSEHLAEIAQKMEAEVHLIDQSLRNVSQNADRSEQLAKETMDAAQSGQTSVDASIQGMNELKEVISHSARLIQEVNTSGEQISSVLDIVDDITEQTSLLSLNASIISAQAGEHGRGFAVVADEIKELVLRTKSSTQEIGNLIHALQVKTEDSVKSIEEGIAKADEGVRLVSAVKNALNTILERATRSSTMATDTARVVQQTTESAQVIKSSMTAVTEMVSQITTAIREEKQDISRVVAAVENIREMSEQVNNANMGQNKASEQIVNGMENITVRLSEISDQAEELKNSSDQILNAMHMIESITKNVLFEAMEISGSTANNMAKQAEVLKDIVTVFKVS